MKQKVRSANRTKALLHGLPLDADFKFLIGIESTGAEDKHSKREEVTFTREMLRSIAVRKNPPPAPSDSSSACATPFSSLPHPSGQPSSLPPTVSVLHCVPVPFRVSKTVARK